MAEALARAHIFYQFDAFAARKGFDFDRLLASEGLCRQDLANPDNEIPLNSAAHILTKAAVACGDPCVGLHWAECYPAGATGVVGYLMKNAATVRDAITGLARYQCLVADSLDAVFVEAEGAGQFQWRYPAGLTAPRVQYGTLGAAVIVMRLRQFIGSGWMPLEVQLEHRALPCKEDVIRVFGPNVRFDCSVNSIHIAEAVLNRVNDKADPRLYELMHQLGGRMLAERKSRADIVDLTAAAITKRLGCADVTLEQVADSLNLSVRILQARLTAAGTNFETILQDTRQRLADNHLRDSDKPLTEIAFLLGFSELSAFTRASQRWFKMSPKDRRVMLRQHSGPKP